jgi:hypothetical protein
VKNHDFTPENHIFPILGEARKIFWVFHVKNHDFTPKKSYFFPILGGGRAPGAPPLNPPLHLFKKKEYYNFHQLVEGKSVFGRSTRIGLVFPPYPPLLL